MAAKAYGIPIKPVIEDEKRITEMAEHLNWSKTALLTYMVNQTYNQVMSLPRAFRPEDLGNS